MNDYGEWLSRMNLNTPTYLTSVLYQFNPLMLNYGVASLEGVALMLKYGMASLEGVARTR